MLSMALLLDPKQDAAAKLLTDLGWVSVDGKWMKESDWLVSQGKVRYEGKIMTIAEADAIKAQEKVQLAQKEAQQVVDDKIIALEALDKRIIDLPKRPAEIDKEIAKSTSDLSTAQEGAKRSTTLKKVLDDAEKRLSDAQAAAPRPQGTAGNNRGAPTAPAPAQNLATLQQSVDDAQRAYNAARRESQSADQDVMRLKGKIAALTDEKKNLDKKGDELRLQREKIAKELDKAKADLENTGKKSSAAAPTAAAP